MALYKTLKIAVLLTAYDKLSSVVSSAVSKSEARLNRLKKVSDNISKFGTAALIAGGVGTAFFAGTVHAAEESEVAQNRLRQVFKSMGQDYAKATGPSR